MGIKPSVLFVLDKWCAGNPDFGISEWESNLWGSLESSGLATCQTFHCDEYYYLYQQAGDDALLRKCLNDKPDLVCLVIYRIPGSDFNVLTLRTLEIIRHQLNIPTIAIWGDIYFPEDVEISKMVLPFVDFNVCTASSAAVSRIAQPRKYTYFWVPKDSRYFYNPGIEREIPISYVGSPKLDRLAAIKYLRKNGIDTYQSGGERQEHISTKQYAQIFMRSKIALSVSRSGHQHVTNARAFEATLCGAMLLEEEGFETAKLFTPFVDYVLYSSHRDLVEKAKHYLTHDVERQQIANRGCKKAQEHYSANRFWKLVLNRALKSTNSEQDCDKDAIERKIQHLNVPTSKGNVPADEWGTLPLGLPAIRLSKLPLRRSLKLRILNRAYSNVTIYTTISDFQRILIFVKGQFWTIYSHSHSAKRFVRTVKRLVKKQDFERTITHHQNILGR